MPAQRRARDLESRVASTAPSESLPVRLGAGRREPLAPPTVLGALDLGRDRWLLVLARDLLTSAVVEVGEGYTARDLPGRRCVTDRALAAIVDGAP